MTLTLFYLSYSSVHMSYLTEITGRYIVWPMALTFAIIIISNFEILEQQYYLNTKIG